jgi:hypothetical protein
MKSSVPEVNGTPSPSHKKLKRTLLIIGSILIIVPIFIIIFISPITKYMVEKYSVKYTGRQIKMDWAYVNPFTGHAHFSNFKVYEANGDSIFFSANGISVDFALRKMLSKTYEITNLVLDKPKGVIIVNERSKFNFSDLILRFASKADSTAPPAPPLHFNILNVKINDGTFYFISVLSKINYFIKDVNFETSGKWWNEDTVIGKVSFSSGIGTGDMKINFMINLNTLDYRYALIVHKFSLAIIEQYLKDITSYGTFSATLDANMKATGNLTNEENLDEKGRIQINDFHFGKTPKDDYLSFDRFVMVINEVNPEKHLYHLDSVILTHPYFKYEQYDYLDNIETMFGENGANVTAVDADPKKFNLIIELGHYLVNISKNFFESAYKINNLALANGNIHFNDYSKSEEFSIAANPLYITADSVYQNKEKIKMVLKTGIQPYGYATVYASINPQDSEDFDVDFQLAKIPLAMFNPYLISYTSFPLDRGTIEFNGQWKVRNGVIQSENHLLIIDPSVSKRAKNKADKWIPMWLAMYLVRDRGNVIDYEIPVTGSLKKPKFHLHDIIFSTLKNIFVKPVTTPYRLEVRAEEKDIDNSFAMKWETRQSSLGGNEKKFVEKIAKFLSENPGASIVIQPEQYSIKEKEYILFFEAKKKYYLSLNPGKAQLLSEDDSEYVNKMSVKDPLFIHYLDKHLTHTLVFTIQDKCSNLISPAFVNAKFAELNKARENTFLSCFTGKGVDNKIAFNSAQNNIPYNGFSFYKITYKGELPGYLLKAYDEMDELNNKNPREKYKNDRGKLSVPLTKSSN